MNKPQHTASKLALVAIAMFAFGFALVPIYDKICEITGLNGKTGTIEASTAATMEINTQRTVTIEFIANLNQSAPFAFNPIVKKLQIHPGGIYTMEYLARNLTDASLVAQASPSVSPSIASSHLKKIECFCFQKQYFEAHEERRMPVQFIVAPTLPDHIKTITLAYTFFDITSKLQPGSNDDV